MSKRWQHIRRHPATRLIVIAGLFIVLALAVIDSIQAGTVDVPSEIAYKATLDATSDFIRDATNDFLDPGYQSDLDYTDRDVRRLSALITTIRLPRVVMAVLVGIGLALSGSTLQGVLRNPLAEPSLIGVSSGAAVGAISAIAFDFTFTLAGYEMGAAAFSFAGAIAGTILVYRLAYYQRRTNATTMLLIGVAFSAISAAYVGLMTFRAGQEKVGDIVFWSLGSLGAVKWDEVELTAAVILVGTVFTLPLARSLNVMALGEVEAGYLGIDVQRMRLFAIILSAFMTGIGVAYVGIIGFVGLVVPHLIRLLFGPDHRLLLPASMLGGAIFVLEADILARTVTTSEVPLGVITTLIGGPFFLFLILLYQRRGV